MIVCEIKLLTSWPWNGKTIVDHPDRANVITRALTHGRGGQMSQCQRWHNMGKTYKPLRTLKIEGGQEPRNAESCESWKGQESTFSSRTSRKECSLVDALDLAQWDPYLTSDLQNYELGYYIPPLLQQQVGTNTFTIYLSLANHWSQIYIPNLFTSN